jgi:hypothetical protein
MPQQTCHYSLLLTPLTLMAMAGDRYPVIFFNPHPTIYGDLASSSEHETFHWHKSKLLTMEIWKSVTGDILWQNLRAKNESDDKSCNLLTTKKLRRLGGSKPLLKTSLHASQARWLARTFLRLNLTPRCVLGPDLSGTPAFLFSYD